MESTQSIQQLIATQVLHLQPLKEFQLTLQISSDQKTVQVLGSEAEAKPHLFQAIKQGKVDIVRWLLTYQPKWLKLMTPSGTTLLHLAIEANQWPVVTLLLQLGANLWTQNQQGAGLLHDTKDPNIAKQLLERAPQLIEMRDYQGNTPLHYAAAHGNLEMTQMLIEQKAWIEAKNALGQTALHTAAFHGQQEITDYLLEKRANYQATDKQGRLPEKLAKEQNHLSLALYFTEYRAQLKLKHPIQAPHTTITGTLTKTQYYQLTKVYPQEAKDLYQQTGIRITFAPNQKNYVWPKQGGHFGQVGLGRNSETGQFVAIKEITGPDKINASLNEGKLQKTLEGLPNLMPLYDYFYDDEKIYQFMLYAEFGDGQSLKKKLATLNQPELLYQNPLLKIKLFIHTAQSLLTGIHALHQLNLIHGDAKPDNLLIDRYLRIYVSDFGTAYESAEDSKDTRGDIRYFSPEKLKVRLDKSQPAFNPKLADAWAIGMTLLEIGSFLDVSTFNSGIEDFTPEFLIQKTQLNCLNYPGIFQIIKGLLAPNPKNRLSVEAALQNELFQSFELTQTEKEQAIALFQSTPPLSQTQTQADYDESPKIPDVIYPDQPKTPPVKAIYSKKEASSPINVNYGESPKTTKADTFYPSAKEAEQAKDYLKAISLYEQSYQSGTMKAASHLGLLYLRTQDKPKAYDYLLKASEQGDTTSMMNLAQMLEYGDGVLQDKKTASFWYQTLLGKGITFLGKDKLGKDITTQSKIDKLKL